MAELSELLGKTLSSVKSTDKVILFRTTDGKAYKMYHEQDCCESVSLDDVVGDLQDLVGEPILRAEKVDGETPADFNPDDWLTYLWTFYKFATRKGYVDLRWFGTGSGYYSKSVDFVALEQDEADDLEGELDGRC